MRVLLLIFQANHLANVLTQLNTTKWT